MAKVREVLRHLTVEEAKSQRICHRNRDDHSIRTGERCLVIHDAASGGKKNYCLPCAAEILNRCAEDLAQLRGELRLRIDEGG